MSKKNSADRCFLQFAMPDWVFDEWVKIAEDLGQDRKSILEEMILEFINRTNKQTKESSYALFYASPKNSKLRSLWLSPAIYDKVEEFSVANDTRPNRTVFTALVAGLVKRNRLTIN